MKEKKSESEKKKKTQIEYFVDTYIVTYKVTLCYFEFYL